MTLLKPASFEAITGKLGGIFRHAQVEIGLIEFEVLDTVRNNHALSKAEKVIVIGLHFSQSIELPGSIEVAQILPFLGIDTDNRVGRGLILGH